MARLTLDEELFLLARDPGSGRDTASMGVDTPLAGAVLIELAEAGAITIDDGRITAHPGADLPRAHLQAARDLIAAEHRPRKPKHWLARLPRTLSLQEKVGLSLVEQGVLRDARSSFLGFTIKRFPVADASVRKEIRTRIAAALTGTDPRPTPRTKLLAGLLGAADLVRRLVDRSDRRAARKKAKEFLLEEPAGAAVSDAVRAVQQAAVAAIAASVSASAAASATSGGT